MSSRGGRRPQITVTLIWDGNRYVTDHPEMSDSVLYAERASDLRNGTVHDVTMTPELIKFLTKNVIQYYAPNPKEEH